MSNWIEVVSDTVVNVVVSSDTPSASTPGEYLPQPYGVGIGWTRSGGVWTGPAGETQPVEPPPPGPQYRTVLVGAEWVATFTDNEWDWIDVQRNTAPRTTAIKELRKLMDAIRWTDSVNVASTNIDPFYTWLLNNGIPGGQARIDELRAGVLE